MTNALVSIITPTFNRAYCLARTLDSALCQTYPHLEVIVVDDGSSDNTRDLVLGTFARDARVKYLHQENQGVSAARNTGIRAAQGAYIAFLDSDDIWKPWKLQLQISCLNALPSAGMIWSDMEAVDPDGRVSDPRYLHKMYDAYRWFRKEDLFTECRALRAIDAQLTEIVGDTTVHVGDIFSQMFMGNLVHTSTVLLRRDRMDRVKGFNEDLHLSGEDYDFHFRTCREGPVAFIDLATIQYQIGMPDRLTQHNRMVGVNFLKTITTILQENGDRIALPGKMIHHSLARAHAWVGEACMETGDYRNARRHLASSIFHEWWRLRSVVLLGLCCLPTGTDKGARRLYQWLKAPFRRSRHAATSMGDIHP